MKNSEKQFFKSRKRIFNMFMGMSKSTLIQLRGLTQISHTHYITKAQIACGLMVVLDKCGSGNAWNEYSKRFFKNK